MSRRLPTQRAISVADWLRIQPFPGHRDSEKRAQKANHLFKLEPTHCRVDAARLVSPDGNPILDEHGHEQIRRLTGNTRAQVWRCGLSDQVPDEVIADVYDVESFDEMKELGLRFDSPRSSWTAADYSFRAFGMTFDEKWRPLSQVLRTNHSAVSGGLRRADAISRGHLNPRGSSETELIMPRWSMELKFLDSMLETSVAESVMEKRPFRTPVVAALLLLIRCEEQAKVREFVHSVLHDEGTKTEQGYDGVQLAIESLSPPNTRGRPSAMETELTARIISSYLLWESGRRTPTTRLRILDVVVYYEKAISGRGKTRLPEQPPAATEPVGEGETDVAA